PSTTVKAPSPASFVTWAKAVEVSKANSAAAVAARTRFVAELNMYELNMYESPDRLKKVLHWRTPAPKRRGMRVRPVGRRGARGGGARARTAPPGRTGARRMSLIGKLRSTATSGLATIVGAGTDGAPTIW